MASRRELLEVAVVEAARAVMAQVLLRERRIGVLADTTVEEAEALQTLRDALLAERQARGAVRWDGRYSCAPAEVNAGPLPAIRSALYEAKSRIDHAVAALDTITSRGPGFLHAIPEMNNAVRQVERARALARPEADEQVRRGLSPEARKVAGL